MMTEREILKYSARQQIKGKILTLFVISLITGVITVAVNFVPFIGAIANLIFITPAFSLALVMIYMDITNGKEIKIEDIFNGFKDFWGAFKVQFFVNLFTYLWSLLFVVPGIVKGYSYSMAMFIWAENKEIGALEAIRKSKEMMYGHRMDFFVFQLTFIGWILLGVITFGIAFVYVEPYMSAATVNYYYNIKQKKAFNSGGVPIYSSKNKDPEPELKREKPEETGRIKSTFEKKETLSAYEIKTEEKESGEIGGRLKSTFEKKNTTSSSNNEGSYFNRAGDLK